MTQNLVFYRVSLDRTFGKKPIPHKLLQMLEEAIRKYGQDRTSYAALSRSVVGMAGTSLVMSLPGSTKGAVESLNAVFPEALHLFDIIKGAQH